MVVLDLVGDLQPGLGGINLMGEGLELPHGGIELLVRECPERGGKGGGGRIVRMRSRLGDRGNVGEDASLRLT